MEGTVGFVVAFIVVAVIIGIGVTMLGNVENASVIETESGPAYNSTGTLTPASAWIRADGSCSRASPPYSYTGQLYYVSGGFGGDDERVYYCATSTNSTALSYSYTYQGPNYALNCPGLPTETGLAIASDGTPATAGSGADASVRGKTLAPVRTMTQAEIPVGDLVCPGIDASAWGEVQLVYTEQSQSSFGLFIIILIVIAAVVILFVLRYLY